MDDRSKVCSFIKSMFSRPIRSTKILIHDGRHLIHPRYIAEEVGITVQRAVDILKELGYRPVQVRVVGKTYRLWVSPKEEE